MDPKDLASHLDFANHHPNATEADIRYVCEKVIEYGFNSAFMNPYWVPITRLQFNYTGKIGTIVSFPLGQDSVDFKAASAKTYASWGADELDTSLNISLLKEAKWAESLAEMKQVVETVKTAFPTKIIKFILETGYLTPAEIQKGSELILQSGADYVKTNSGMGPTGARLEDLPLIKAAIGDQIPIKCAGGIDTREEALAFLTAGAFHLGTSHALQIIGVDPGTPAAPPTALTE